MSETWAFDAPPGDDFVYLAAFQQLVLERSHDLITVTDPLGTIVYVSPSWHTVLGWDPEALLGTPAMELVHPDDHVRAGEAMQVALDGGEVEGITVRFRSHTGNWIAIEASSSAIRDAGGNVAYLLGTARDVSEREELRDRVLEIDALYRIADAIARMTGLTELFDEAVETLLDATDADRASVLLYDEAPTMRFIASRGLSEEYRAATEGHSPWGPDAIDPEPVLVPDAAAAGFDPELETAILREGIGALAFIPLVHDGRLLGKFMLYRNAPHEWLDLVSERQLPFSVHLKSN